MKIKQMETVLGTQQLVVIDTGYKAGGQAGYLDIDKNTARQRETGSTWGPRIATIQALRQPRKVYSGARWDFGGHTSNTGVMVEYEDGTRATVAPTDVIDTLDDYRSTFIDSSAAAAKRQNDKQSHNDRVEGAIARINAALAAATPNEARAPKIDADLPLRWNGRSPSYSELKRGTAGMAALELIADLLNDR